MDEEKKRFRAKLRAAKKHRKELLKCLEDPGCQDALRSIGYPLEHLEPLLKWLRSPQSAEEIELLRAVNKIEWFYQIPIQDADGRPS